MDSLDLGVKQDGWVNSYADFFLFEFEQALFILAFYGLPALTKRWIIHENRKATQLRQIGDPLVADRLGDKGGQTGVTAR